MPILNSLITFLISIIHIMLVLFILLAPFSKSNYILFINILIIPFIILHWVLNNNVCCLTELEYFFKKKEYGIENKEGFINDLITPVYDFKKNNQNIDYYLYGIMTISWFLSCYYLYLNYKDNKILTFSDLYNL